MSDPAKLIMRIETLGGQWPRARCKKGAWARRKVLLLLSCLAVLVILLGIAARRYWSRPLYPPAPEELAYQNYLEPSEPWSIHVVRVPRHKGGYELTTIHATGKSVGLTPVTAQIALFNAAAAPVAAINGDFYQREGPYAGDPRGLQIVDEELISAPQGGASFWIDAADQPHAGIVESRLTITWPDGSSSPIGLNESRPPDRITLYTPALGSSTQTKGGRELVLEHAGDGPWLPLRPNESYHARISEIRDTGNAPLRPGTMVVSAGATRMKTLPRIGTNDTLSLSTGIEPQMRGAKAAISGGPILVHKGRRQRLNVPDSESYEFSTMLERHPRSAVGWNDEFYFLVAVDGRHKGIAEGMTLKELATYLVRLGCREALNLDGGGSATLWYQGQVRNYLCDGYERDVANSVIVLHRTDPIPYAATPPTNGHDVPNP